MDFIKKLAFILVLLGAISWGLVGLFDFNIVTAIFSEGTTGTMVVYVLIGLSGVYELFTSWGKK